MTADPTERLAELERQLAKSADSELLFRALFDATPLAVTIRSLEDARLVDCNPAAVRIFGASDVAELRGAGAYGLLADVQPDGSTSSATVRKHVAMALENGAQTTAWLARRLDGTAFVAEIRTSIIELQDGRKVFQTIIEDRSAEQASKKATADAERALRASEARYRQVVEGSRDIILTEDLDGRVLFASPSIEAVLGYPPDVWTNGMTPRDIALPATRDRLLRLVEASRETGDASPGTVEAALRHRDGRTVYLEYQRTPIYDGEGRPVGKHIIARDVTERHHVETERQKRAAREELLSSIARRLLDEDNQAVTRDALGQIRDMLDAESVTLEFGGGTDPGDGAVLRAAIELGDGQPRSIKALARSGRTWCAEDAGFLRSVAELVAIGQMRHAAAVALSRAKEDAVAASAAKSAFVANISHELRTPLGAVIGVVDLLERTPLDASQRRYVEIARVSATLLLSVINDVLDLSKIEAGKLEIENAELSLADVVGEVTSMLATNAEKKGVALRTELDPALPGTLLGDGQRLRQVLVNLVGNAIKFTTVGEVVTRVTLVDPAGQGPGSVRVEVRDTGMGMATELLPRLFQPFSQGDARKHGGAGLGLAICRELVTRMGGQIGVESSLGEGSTFWFTLPSGRSTLRRDLVGHPSPPTRPMPEHEPFVARVAAFGRRILLVEDAPIGAEVVGEILRTAGYAYDVAPDGESAIQAVQRVSYDLVLMDGQLPDIDGHEAARRIRGLEADGRLPGGRAAHLPILGFTAGAARGDLELARKAGMDDHLSKPVEPRRLLATLAAHLAGSCAASDGASAPVDLDHSLERLQGNRALLTRLIDQFAVEAATTRERLRAGLAASDAASLAYLAHRLRGQAAILDASALVEALLVLEGDAARETWPAAAATIARVEAELDRVLVAIARPDA